MSSNSKKSLLRTVLTANGGCGCGKPKPSDVHDPTPKPKISNIYQNTNHPSSSLNSSTTSGERNGGLSVDDDGDFTSTTVSEEAEALAHDHNKSPNMKNIMNFPKMSPKLMDSVAVEKDSADPYQDFRHSMLQMIFEKEIDSEDDLQELLRCFLELNAPSQHQVIVQAFDQICQEAFPKVSARFAAAAAVAAPELDQTRA